MLLTFGASVNKRENQFGNTALHYACLTGNTCAIRLLIDANAEIDVSNKKVIITKFNGYFNKNVTIKILMFNLVFIARFCNNLHQVRS